MRSILLVILSLAILFSAFFVYARFETKGTHTLDRVGSFIAPPPPPRADQSKPGVIKAGEYPWISTYDEVSGELKNRFRGESYTPQDDGIILVKNPVAEFFMGHRESNSGPNARPQKMRMTGTTGEMVMPETSAGPTKSAMGALPRGSPNRGSIHDCKIELFNIFPDSGADPDETIWMNNVQFDNETMLITTEAYKDTAADRMVPPDQVHVTMRGKKYDFDGRGLRLRWNDKDGRLELLEVAHGERLIIKDSSAVSGTLTPGGTKHPPAASASAYSVGSALADALSSGAYLANGVRQGGPYETLPGMPDAFFALTPSPGTPGEVWGEALMRDSEEALTLALSRPTGRGDQNGSGNRPRDDASGSAGVLARVDGTNAAEDGRAPRSALPFMFASTDKSAAIGAATSSANPPAKVKPPAPPIPYLATFYNNVRIVQGDEVLINADRMDVDFTTRKESAAPTTAPSAAHPGAASHASTGAPAGPTSATPRVHPDAAGPVSASQNPATTPATTKPAAQPVVIYWTGKLVMSPAKGNVPKALAGDAIVELTGKPVAIRRTPPAPQEGDDIKAARVVYHTGDGSVKLFNSESAPQIVISKIVNGKINPESAVTTSTLDYAVDATGRKYAVLTGPGHAMAPVESKDAKQVKSRKPAEQHMDVHWSHGAKIYFVPNGKDEQAIEHMDLAGDVDVKHPQLAMQSQALSLYFEPPSKSAATVVPISTAAKTPPKENSQAELKRVLATDAVHCVIAGANGKKQTIDCNTLEMRTAKAADGKFYARTIDAQGAVHARDEDQDLRARTVLLTLRPAKPAAKKEAVAASVPPAPSPAEARAANANPPAGAPATLKTAATQGAGPDTSENAAVELEKMIARDDVQVINKEGSRATGSELIVTASDDGSNHVRLTGSRLATVVDAKKNVVTGPLITVDPKSGIAHVIGAGNMHMLQDQADGSKPKPMDVAWTDRADMDGAQNAVDVLGDVIVKTIDSEGAVSTATGDRVHIDLVKKLSSTTRPSLHASTQPAKPANGMQMDVMKDKDARTITISGASAKVKSILAAPNGTILRQFVIIGPKIIYQLLDSPSLQAKTLWVPSAGQMFMGDHRPADKPKAGAKKGDDDSSSRGDTAFKWNRQLVYSESERKAVMTEDVIIVHQPDGKESAQGPVRINADQVTAWFDVKPGEKPATKPVHGPADPQTAMQLKHLTAAGHVTITRATATLTGDSVEYDPLSHWMVAHGTDNVDAKYEDSQNTTVSKSAKDMGWNTQTWNINIVDPKLVNPR